MMNKFWLPALILALFSLTIAFACSGGDDDDDDASTDDDNDDDAVDDDDDDDDNTDDDSDDDITGDLTVDNISQSACGDENWDPAADPTDVIEVTWQDGVLKIDDRFGYVNCGLELTVSADASGNTVTVTESNTGELQDCNCPMNLHYEVAGIDAAAITLKVMRAKEEKETIPLVEMNLTLGEENKVWYIPHVSIFSFKYVGENPPGPTDEVVARYGACDLYHIEDQQFYARQDTGLIRVFGYDWYDLDNPGTPVEGCQLPVEINGFGVLGNDAYTFVTPSNEDGEWSILTWDYPVVE